MSENNPAVLFSAYLPPVEYIAALFSHTPAFIEQHEHFQKQTCRNRCHIYSANGLLKLSIPIRHGHTAHMKIRDVKISYDSDWQKIHWRSIESSYRCSPFFEYYEEYFAPFFTRKTEFLFDLNQELLDVILRLLKHPEGYSYTDSFVKSLPEGTADYRNLIRPKASDAAQVKTMHDREYQQVFGNKYGFLPNLSILDLMFNEGPQATGYLKNSWLKV